MGAVRSIAALAVAMCLPLPATAQGVSAWHSYIVEASYRSGVPIAWIERVMRIESRGAAEMGGRPTVSKAGAMGLMQLMPETWAAMRDLAGLGNDPFDPHDNVLAGALYLHLLYERFGYPGLFAAYNAGPGRYTLYLRGQRGLPQETVRYLVATADRDKFDDPAPVRRPSPIRRESSIAPPATVFAIAPRPLIP